MEQVDLKLLELVKDDIRQRVDERVGSQMQNEDKDDYEAWQSMLSPIDSVETFEDTIESPSRVTYAHVSMPRLSNDCSHGWLLSDRHLHIS
ncbi:MAG: hypothetical protein WCS09_16265 [Pseudomonadota bacterium]